MILLLSTVRCTLQLRRKSWNLALGIISESPDPDTPAFYMVSGLGGNSGAGGFDAGGFNDTNFNNLVLLEENTTGVAQRVALFQQIDSYIHQQLPVLELYYQIEVVAWTSNVNGFTLGLGNPWHDYWGALKCQSLANITLTSEQQPSVKIHEKNGPPSSFGYSKLGGSSLCN